LGDAMAKVNFKLAVAHDQSTDDFSFSSKFLENWQNNGHRAFLQ
jgi:hypothetical protein